MIFKYQKQESGLLVYNQLYEFNEKNYLRVFVVSDLHGRGSAFFKAFRDLNMSVDDLIIIAGDTCDRGEDTIKLYDFFIDKQEKGFNIIHLLGNHEDMMYKYYYEDFDEFIYFQQGGQVTQMLYNNDLKKREQHLEFIGQMSLIAKSDEFIITHSGLNPQKPDLSTQTQEDLLWTEDFSKMDLSQFSQKMVFGHRFTSNGKIQFYHNNSIGIDCGLRVFKHVGILELRELNCYYFKEEK